MSTRKFQWKFKIFSLAVFFFKIAITFGQTDSSMQILERDILNYTNIAEPQPIDTFPSFSAMRSTMNVNDIPITSFTISREEIQNNGYLTLTDVLKNVPGIRVSQPGSAEDGELFLCRGLIGNSYMKILINNVPILPSVRIAMHISAQLPIRQAERIEIIFGPASSVYGADAATGVINIITKNVEKNGFAQADISAGKNGFGFGNFICGGQTIVKSDFLKYSIYGGTMRMLDKNIKYQNSDKIYSPMHFFEVYNEKFDFGTGAKIAPLQINQSILSSINYTEQQFVDYITPKNYVGTLNSANLAELPEQSNLMGFNLQYKGISLSYDYQSQRIHSSIGKITYLYRYNNPKNYLGETVQRLVLTLNKRWKKLLFTTNLSYLRNRSDNQSSYGINYCENMIDAYTYSASDDFFFDAFLTSKPKENLEILIGSTGQISGNLPLTNFMKTAFDEDKYTMFSTKNHILDENIGNFGFNPLIYKSIGTFLQIHYKYKKFVFAGGLRKDYHTHYHESTTPRIAILYKWKEKLSFRISYGKAFKTPTSAQTYYSVAYQNNDYPDSISYVYIPNENLQPEKFSASEFAFTWKPKENVSFDFSFYSNEVLDPIYITYTAIDSKKYPKASHDDLVRTNVNSQGAMSQLSGFQFVLNLKSKNSKNVLRASYLYSEGKETLPNNGGEINKMRMVPKHFGQIYLETRLNRILFISMNHTISSSWIKRFVYQASDIDREYFTIPGYYTLDLMLRLNITKQLSFFTKVINVFDTEYGGIDATGIDIDLRYNPQLKRNIRFGISYRFE